jgi:hypothetical protein
MTQHERDDAMPGTVPGSPTAEPADLAQLMATGRRGAVPAADAGRRSDPPGARLPPAPPAPPHGRRARLYGWLLAANLLVLGLVLLLPTTSPPRTPAAPAADPAAAARQVGSAAVQSALLLASRGEFTAAMSALEPALGLAELPTSPRVQMLRLAAHWAARSGDLARARALQQRADALVPGLAVPADLVAMADAAIAAGDRDALARVWLRFRLQEREVPGWLEPTLALAWLGLGGAAAEARADAARIEAIERSAARLAAEAQAR